MPQTPELLQALQSQRQQFPALGNKLYFNYGGQGPLPKPAVEAILSAYSHLQDCGPFSAQALEWITHQAASTRRSIAGELGVAPETITLTESVSVGCNIPLWGIAWQPGDHLLLSDCEHPGIVAAGQQLQRRFGVTTSTVALRGLTDTETCLEQIQAALRPQTRLLVLSHILWNTGQVLPLAEIVRVGHTHSPRPVAVLVDAAQSVGVLPLDLATLGADYYAFTGHKWCCGPDGLGGLYVHPEAVEPLEPTFIGWRSVITDASGNPVDWKPDGRRFEVATAAFPLCAGLRAALDLHQQWGTAQERYQRICQLSLLLWQGLRTVPGVDCLSPTPPQAGLVAFTVATLPPTHLVQLLETQGIMVRSIPDPSCVRACVHYMTLETEVEQLVAQVATLAG